MAEKHLNKNLIEQEKYIEKNLQVYLGVWKKKKETRKKDQKIKRKKPIGLLFVIVTINKKHNFPMVRKTSA